MSHGGIEMGHRFRPNRRNNFAREAMYIHSLQASTWKLLIT